MENPFKYPQDRSELFEPTDEREAHFYFTCNDFHALIKDYGVEHVMNRLEPELFDTLAEWFLDEE